MHTVRQLRTQIYSFSDDHLSVAVSSSILEPLNKGGSTGSEKRSVVMSAAASSTEKTAQK
eukprot:6202176-Pleurochrysis_carterae.AAC.3